MRTSALMAVSIGLLLGTMQGQEVAKTGTLHLSSTPSGARVIVDNIYKGDTPCNITGLTPGYLVFRVEKKGYESCETNIKTGGDDVKVVTLKKTFLPRKGKSITTNTDGSILVEIPAGTFIMGLSNVNYFLGDRQPEHTVYLSKYYIGKYEVTVGQFRKFVNATGYITDAEKKGGSCVIVNGNESIQADANWDNPYFTQTEDCPVVCISWNDAKAYCTWARLRLPTEAEWEKAARGIDGRIYPWGNWWNASKLNSYGGDDKYIFTAPVGSFPTDLSPYGCYDMAGNVMEWVNDWYGEKYYSCSPDSNPTGPKTGVSYVMRGGSWVSKYTGCTERTTPSPDRRYSWFGFRVAK